MARLGKDEQLIIKRAIHQHPEKTNAAIAEEFGVSVHAVAGLRRGISRHQSNDKHHVNTRTRQNMPAKHQWNDSVEMQKQAREETHARHVPDISLLMTCLKETAQLLIEEPDRVGTLLYRYKPTVEYCPRELEAQHILSNVFSRYGVFHMLESPTTERGSQGFIDVTIYSRDRIRLVDIELKEDVTGADRDFPKLAMSLAFGSVVFFIANQKHVDMVLSNIMTVYQEVYARVFAEIPEEQIRDKWFLFFLVACKERRMYVQHYPSIKQVDFSCVLRNRIQ